MTLNISRGGFWRSFVPLFGIGIVGVAALAPLAAQQLAALPGVARQSLPLLLGAALAQTTLLVAGAVAVGVALAPRLGLRSHLATTSGKPLLAALRAEFPFAVFAGGLGAVVMLAGDAVFRPFMLESMTALESAMPHTTLTMTVTGVLYGGIVEELLLRWCVMTLLAWILWRLQSRRHAVHAVPSRAVMWIAIIGAALLFGAGHLPATALIVPLTPIVILRALVLNGVGGGLFGWLYWRRSLEAGMIAHATFHVVATMVALISTM